MTQDLMHIVEAHGQKQVLNFWNILDESEQEQLFRQLEELDFENLDSLIKEYVLQKPEMHIPEDLSPAPYYPLEPLDEKQQKLYQQAYATGEKLMRDGKVAALTVAGGQGTRLGFDGPKGTYPIAPISQKSLFQYFAESLRRASVKYGHDFTWYIMTSKLNNQPTQDFFEKNNYFGMAPENVIFFVQGTMPAFDYNGKLLLEEKHSLALAPDGHGGTLLALRRSGCLEKMKKDGVEYISYFQVDNPLVSIINPLFVGLHAKENAEMSALMLAKTGPFEKLGNFCVSKDRLMIIEYSDLPAEFAEQRNTDGSLKFIAGSPAIHVISRSFVEKLTAAGRLCLPWHRADKKIPYINSDGIKVTPEEPNGVKLESFIFDALPLASQTMILEADREEEFAPTKNKTGVDSVESCREMIIERDARRLERAGVKVPRRANGRPAVEIEISPLAVMDDEDCINYCRANGITEIVDNGKPVYLK
ncbi:UDPGP type 1 family protein [Lentisphaerota bacterium ZTH]|nr:UTP--glucose-1-phosphate uridylyltransferase [Lentisphaerota bacterium]WET06916.1 UDPGP type 1 family protein [Lentisphaerota bacterium ZTH]